MSISKASKNICPKGCTKTAHKSSKKLPKKSTKELQKKRPKIPKTIPKKNLPINLPKKSPQKSSNITKSTSSTRSMRYYKNSLTSLFNKENEYIFRILDAPLALLGNSELNTHCAQLQIYAKVADVGSTYLG